MFFTLYEQLQYQFEQDSLLLEAMTHKSYANEHRRKKIKDNEKLEFLGDAVLDLIVSEMLMQRFPLMKEGELSKARAKLVSEAGLSRIAKQIQLGNYLRIGKGEEINGGREKSSLLADALEATVAAIYLDSCQQHSIEKTKEIVYNLFSQEIDSVLESVQFNDYKTELQEYVQKHFQSLSEYRLLGEEGPDHEKIFEMGILINGILQGTGKGTSKKQAEQVAAKSVLEHFTSNPPTK